MRALLLALLLPITTLGCGTESKPTEAAKPSGEPTAMSVEGNSPGSATGSAVGSAAADKPTGAPPPAGYTGGSAAQDQATEAEQAKSVAATEADTKQEAADKSSVNAHKVVSEKLQVDFDVSDRKFAELKEKAAEATGAKKKKADAAIADITKREATVMAGIAKLRDASLAVWDKTKAQLDTDTAAMNKAIAALEVTLR